MDKHAREFVKPLRIAFEVDGCGVEITPIVIDELFALLEASDPIFEELLLADDGVLARFQVGAPTIQDVAWLLRLVAKNGQPVLKALAICTRGHTDGLEMVTGAAHEAWMRRLLPDRWVELFTVCMQVNSDFFSKAMPGFRALASRFKPGPAAASVPQRASPASAGQTPSTS